MLHSTLAKRGCLLLLLTIIAFYFYGLGHLPLVGPDEPRYAQVAREMLLSGDVITPTLGGHTWFEKPILLYWLAALSFQLFGVTEAAARLGPALSGVFTLLGVYWLGRRIERATQDEKPIACTTALILSSMPGMIVFARGASFDMLVTMTLTWALAMFLAAQLNGQSDRQWFYAGFYFFMGLSLLAKGLIGIAIPIGVIAVFHILRWSLPERTFLTSLLWGLPLTIAVSAVWYGPAIARHGWPFIDEFFVQHHFARYVSDKYHHPQPFYYYVLIIFPLALPWLLFAIAEVGRLRRSSFRGNTNREVVVVFAVAWIVAPFLFFSLSTSKLPGYLLPVLPAVAILAVVRLNMWRDADNSATTRIVGTLLIVIGLGGLFYALLSGTLTPKCALLIGTPLFASGTIAVGFPQRLRAVTFSTAAAVPLSFLIALNCDIPQLFEKRSARYFIELADARGFGRAPLYFLHDVERGMEFYAAGRIPYDEDGEPIKFEGASQVLDEARRLQQPVLVIVPVKEAFQLENLERAEVEPISDNGELAIVAVRSTDH